MNRIYSLVWNRALHIVQVVSELTRAGSATAACTAASPLRRHPLALACAAAIVLGAFALPAWSATSCPTGSAALSTATGTTGANGASTTPPASSYGASPSAPGVMGGAGGTAQNLAAGYCLQAPNTLTGGAGGNGGASSGSSGYNSRYLGSGANRKTPTYPPTHSQSSGGAGGTAGSGGLGGAAVTGIGFSLTNVGESIVGGTAGSVRGGIVGGAGGLGGNAYGGNGSDGIYAPQPAPNDLAGMPGGKGGRGGTGGAGGAAISGSGFTLVNAGYIAGVVNAGYIAGGAGGGGGYASGGLGGRGLNGQRGVVLDRNGELGALWSFVIFQRSLVLH